MSVTKLNMKLHAARSDLLIELLVVYMPLSRDRDRRRNWPRTERHQKVSDTKSKKVSSRHFKTRLVRLVEAETFFSWPNPQIMQCFEAD